ncbi:MAG: copper chaperone PCu(A)C [Rhodobacteraceae bacterium]|nr:copper chaperone PCu(A)C [Paracoccaceae bacterium]
MKRTLFAFAFAVFAGLPALVAAGQNGIIVEQAWSRASMGESRPGVAYMVLQNTGSEARILTGVETGVAMMPQIHLTTTDANGVSQMAPAGDLEILPGAAITLEPGGLHIMLMKLKQPLAEGENYSLTLVFKNGDNVEISVPVLSATARGPAN